MSVGDKIETAFVFAAGRGERLRPLTDILPKPLLPLRGKPAICRVFDKFAEIGVRRIIVNIWHLADEFEKTLGREYRGMELIYVRENKLLDTGGGLKNILPLIDRNAPLLVHNGDIFFDAPPQKFLALTLSAAKSNPSLAAALCLRSEGNVKNVAVKNGHVVDMRSVTKIAGDAAAQYTGMFIALPKLFELAAADSRDVFSVVDTFIDAIRSDADSVAAVYENGGAWLDIGSPKTYTEANGEEFSRDDFYRLAALRMRGFFPKNFTRVAKGASSRDFYLFDDGDGDGNYRKLVACFYSKEKREDFLYAKISKFLEASGIPVPRVLDDDATRRILVMENAGSRDLLSLAKSERGAAYASVACATRLLHTRASDDFKKNPFELNAPFDDTLYDWEQNYFLRECVRGRFACVDVEAPAAEFSKIKKILSSEPQCLLHRDLQSQNIMVSDSGEIKFIDFQGMRFGCAMYDLASLAFDPYVKLDNAERADILRAYFGREPTPDESRVFYTAACERLMQALGAYGFLSLKKGKAEYGKYFAPALKNLAYCAGKASFAEIRSVAETCLARI